MNKIGIIGAMDEEIIIMKEKMQIHNQKKIAGMIFFEGAFCEKSVVLVRSGIGKVNAAICSQILMNEFNVDAIINTGVAGAVHAELEVGDIVISDDLVEHDFDATGFGYKLGEIPRMDTSIFKASDQLIELAVKASENASHNTKVGRIVSGDIFVASKEKKDLLWNEFKGYCAEMEGAAIGHTCFMNDIPFVIIRSMSDKADGSAHVNYNEFVEEAAKNSMEMVQKIIKNL